jgi:hypothetical protein
MSEDLRPLPERHGCMEEEEEEYYDSPENEGDDKVQQHMVQSWKQSLPQWVAFQSGNLKPHLNISSLVPRTKGLAVSLPTNRQSNGCIYLCNVVHISQG